MNPDDVMVVGDVFHAIHYNNPVNLTGWFLKQNGCCALHKNQFITSHHPGEKETKELSELNLAIFLFLVPKSNIFLSLDLYMVETNETCFFSVARSNFVFSLFIHLHHPWWFWNNAKGFWNHKHTHTVCVCDEMKNMSTLFFHIIFNSFGWGFEMK